MALVRIDHRALGEVNRDLDRVTGAVGSNIETLRGSFLRLGVGTGNLDAVLLARDELERDILPALHHRQAEAQRVAELPYSGALTDQVASADLVVGPQPPTPETSISALTGGAAVPVEPILCVPDQPPEIPPEEPPLFSIGGLRNLAGDIGGAVQDGAEWLAGKVTEAWDALGEAVSEAWSSFVSWWEEFTADLGAWIDENLDAVRIWIRDNVVIFRIIAIVLKVVGWIMVVVGVVLLILAVVASLTGIGALAGVPGAGVAIALIGWGFAAVGAGDMVDSIADWGEGKIDGQELVQALALEGALTLASAIIPFGFLGKMGSRLLDALPSSMNQKLHDFLERLFSRRPGQPLRGPGPDDLPGPDRPLVGGTTDTPRDYTYPSPGEALRNTPEPTDIDLAGIRLDVDYPVGSQEALLQRWMVYLDRHDAAGTAPWSWDRWRGTTLNNWSREAKGNAYEQAFWDDHGFRGEDGWQRNHDVRTPAGGTRSYDYVDEANGIAYEFKSGGQPNAAQVAKDSEMIQQRDWQIVYVLSEEPGPTARRLMEEAGIDWYVWVGVGAPVP